MDSTERYSKGALVVPARHRRRRSRAVLLALAVVALPATAAAHDDPDPGVDGHELPTGDDPDSGLEVHDRAAAEAIDNAIIARDKGWSLEATRQHMAAQDAFGDLHEQIEAQFPAKFAGAEFAMSPGGRSYLRFKGAVPTAARSLATGSGLNVALTGGRMYSATELQDRSVAAVQFFADAGYQQVGSAVLADGTIEVAVSGQPKSGVSLPPQLSAGVIVRYASGDVVVNEHTYGGAYLHANGGCTTGFVVESLSTGETGVTTAAHCGSSGGIYHYHEPETTEAYDIYFEDEHEGSLGDVQWQSTPHLDLAEYYADETPWDLREVNSVETSAAINNTYCLYSREQGTRTCDQVYLNAINSYTFSGGLVSNLVAMDDENAVGGDSGGPWSYSTEAVGGHRGEQWIWFGWRDVWSRAWLFDSAIGVDVLTQ